MAEHEANPSEEADDNDSSIDRRNVLKGTLAGLVGAGVGSSSVAAHPDADLPHEIVIRSEQGAQYSFTVTGEVQEGELADGNDRVVDDNRVEGELGPRGDDSFRFSGEIKSFEVESGRVAVFINDEQVDDPVGRPDVPHRIVIRSEEGARYSFTVTGEVQTGELADGNDRIEGDDRVEGELGPRGDDSFLFSGRIESFEVEDGQVEIWINGERVDDPVGLPGLPNRIVLTTEGAPAKYSFAVTGTVEMGPQGGDRITDDERVTGSVAPGGSDGYQFSGDFRSLKRIEGPLSVAIEFGDN